MYSIVKYELYESLVISRYCILLVKLEIKNYKLCNVQYAKLLIEDVARVSLCMYKWMNGYKSE